MMRLSERRAQAKAASQEAEREAVRKNLAAAVEAVAEAALGLLRVYEAGRVTPEQNAELGAMVAKMRTELAPIADPLDRARAILDALDAERAAYAP